MRDPRTIKGVTVDVEVSAVAGDECGIWSSDYDDMEDLNLLLSRHLKRIRSLCSDADWLLGAWLGPSPTAETREQGARHGDGLAHVHGMRE